MHRPIWHRASRTLPRIALFLIFAGALLAQPPLLYNRSVTNAASYMPNGIPAGAIAQGSMFSVFGTRIGPSQGVSANSFPLGTTLGGISLNVVQGTTTVSAIPVYVSDGQINAIMPSNAPLGMAALQVITSNTRSNLTPVRIVPSAFGIFSALGTGEGPGILQNYIAPANQPVNSPTLTAQPGQVITLWGTGLGPVSFADNIAPQAGNLPVKTEVFVGGVSAALQYNGRTPCCSGIDQIVFTVPNNAPQGCWVPVYVRTAGTVVSNFVTMAISSDPNSCSTDVLPQFTSGYINGKRIGKAVAARADTIHDVGVIAPVEVTADYHLSFAFEPNPGPYPFNPVIAFPPMGTCTAYEEYGDMMDSSPLPDMAPKTIPLDWGAPLQLTGPGGAKTLTFGFSGARVGELGGLITNNILPGPLYLSPGSYNLQGFGGNDIGPFSASFSIPQPLTWTNRSSLNIVDHTQPLTLSWSGGDGSQAVAILGIAEDLPTNSSAAFVCMAPASASSFTVPPDLLSNFPLTRGDPLQSKDVIYLITMAGSSVNNLNASGLDVGITEYDSIMGKTVVIE